MHNVFVTSYGQVKAGPIFSKVIADAWPNVGKRTKAGKAAKQTLADIERCVEVLARVHWGAGEVLDRTP